jgi:hypothetical protein
MRLSGRIQLGRICLVLAVFAGYCRAQQTVRMPAKSESEESQAAVTDRLKTATKSNGCLFLPTLAHCMKAAGYTDRNKFINDFYTTNGSFSFFNQIKSIYNSASASATVSADLTSLNFGNGMQVNAMTNIQAGSLSPTAVSAGTIPTLSSAGAGQATQNMLYGGTFVASILYPLVAAGVANVNKAGGFGLLVDVVGREGFDIQNFKSGTRITVAGPPSHSSAQIEGYLQYNSTNLATGSSGVFAGAVFVGGSYGYSYMSHDYARDYGFGNNVSNGIGQISVGILINNIAKIAVSRAFGPSQTYIDSTTMTQSTVNNFRTLSVGITYQSPPPSTAK